MEKQGHNISANGQTQNLPFERRLTPQELGDMMNTTPLELLKLDMGFQTEWYSLDVIESILRRVEQEGSMLMLMSYIAVRWRRQVDDCNSNVVKFDVATRSYVPYVEDLPQQLEAIKARVMESRRLREEEETVRRQWEEHFGGTPPVQTAPPSFHQPNETPPPPPPEFHEVYKKVLIKDDETWSLFVNVMRDEVWRVVKGNKGCYADVVRFICNLRGITARKTTRDEFEPLYHAVIPDIEGSLLSSIKRGKYTNEESSYRYYDSIPQHQKKISILIENGKVIERLLQPVIDRMNGIGTEPKAEPTH